MSSIRCRVLVPFVHLPGAVLEIFLRPGYLEMTRVADGFDFISFFLPVDFLNWVSTFHAPSGDGIFEIKQDPPLLSSLLFFLLGRLYIDVFPFSQVSRLS